MPPSRQSRIFISYARKDGTELARRLRASLLENGFDAWLDTQRISGGAVWSAQLEREVDAREVTLALLSPGSFASEICRAEQLRALDKGNRVIPVLAVKGSDRPIYLYAQQYRDLSNDAEYTARLSELLDDISRRCVCDPARSLPQDPRHVPDRPATGRQLPRAA